jgi:CubicO group peptidase (beta-lactamase class C family)
LPGAVDRAWKTARKRVEDVWDAVLRVIHGTVEPGFWPLARTLERQVERLGGGAAVCVYHRGRKVADLWAGERDADGHPWTSNTMAMSFSTTKGVVSTALHVLADRGELGFEDRVARFWPEFAQAGKGSITLRDVLSHRAGLPQVRPLLDRPDRILDWDYMTEALAETPPQLKPGGPCAYHAFTFGWLAGEILRRVTGQAPGEAVRTLLAQPLGLDGCYIGAPADVRGRAAALIRPRFGGVANLITSQRLMGALDRVYRAARIPISPLLIQSALLPGDMGELFFEPRILDAPIPSANGLFTARSLARIYALLAEGGMLDGVRLLSRRSVTRASQVQTRERDRVLLLPMHWRLGYHSAFTTRGRLATGFGHFGYGGSGAWCDPEQRLAVAMVTNQVAGGPFGDMRIARLGAAAVRCARQARGRPHGEVLDVREREAGLANLRSV